MVLQVERGLIADRLFSIRQRAASGRFVYSGSAMIDTEEVLRHAATFYQAGRLGEAEELCLSILQAEPRQAGANYLLGLAELQQGRAEHALPRLQMAWEVDPSEGRHWLALTECLLALGQFEDASVLIRQAIKRGMDTPEARQLRQIAKRGQDRTAPPAAIAEEVLASFRAGRYAELEAHARKVLEQYPGWALGWSALGVALSALRKDAEGAMRRAVELAPLSAEAHNNLGVLLRGRGRMEEGLTYLRKALELRPKYAEAHYNFGAAMQDADRYEDAAASYRKAMEINPDYSNARAALGGRVGLPGEGCRVAGCVAPPVGAYDVSREKYPEWAHLPFITEPGFDDALKEVVRMFDIGGIFTPNPVVWNYLNQNLKSMGMDVALVNDSPVNSELNGYRDALDYARALRNRPFWGSEAQTSRPLMSESSMPHYSGMQR